jgi:hypothetical protein
MAKLNPTRPTHASVKRCSAATEVIWSLSPLPAAAPYAGRASWKSPRDRDTSVASVSISSSSVMADSL